MTLDRIETALNRVPIKPLKEIAKMKSADGRKEINRMRIWMRYANAQTYSFISSIGRKMLTMESDVLVKSKCIMVIKRKPSIERSADCTFTLYFKAKRNAVIKIEMNVVVTSFAETGEFDNTMLSAAYIYFKRSIDDLDLTNYLKPGIVSLHLPDKYTDIPVNDEVEIESYVEEGTYEGNQKTLAYYERKSLLNEA